MSQKRFSTAKELRQESSMWITGVIHQDSRSHFGYGIEVRNIELVGDSRLSNLTEGARHRISA